MISPCFPFSFFGGSPQILLMFMLIEQVLMGANPAPGQQEEASEAYKDLGKKQLNSQRDSEGLVTANRPMHGDGGSVGDVVAGSGSLNIPCMYVSPGCYRASGESGCWI